MDSNYEIAYYIVQKFPFIDDLDLKTVMEDCFVSRSNIKKFVELFQYPSWQAFHKDLIVSRNIRRQQMENFYTIDHLKHCETKLNKAFEYDNSYKKVLQQIQPLIKELFKAKTIHVVGAIYPLAIMQNFQIDMANLHKPVVFHYDVYKRDDLHFEDDDHIIVLTSSGRFVRECTTQFYEIYNSHAKKTLITCSDQFHLLHQIDHYIELKDLSHDFDFCIFTMIIFEYIMTQYYLEHIKEVS